MNRKLVLVFIVLGLAALACSELAVGNSSNQIATVRVTLPDSSVNVIVLFPGDGDSWISAEGGDYTVEVLPNEMYLDLMRGVADEVVLAMANEELSSGEEVLGAVLLLADIQHQIDATLVSGTMCSGELPYFDFEYYGGPAGPEPEAVYVTLLYDKSTVTWSCGE